MVMNQQKHISIRDFEEKHGAMELVEEKNKA